MRTLKEIDLGGQKVQVRQLTLREMDKLLTSMREQKEPKTLDWVCGESRLPSAALEAIVCMNAEDIIDLDLNQEELATLCDEAEKLNPFVVEAVGQMRKVAQLETIQSTPGLNALLSLLSSGDSPIFGNTPLQKSAGSSDSLMKTMEELSKK